MKAIRYSIMLALLAAVLPSCKSVTDIFLPDNPPEYYDYYFLQASFKDAQGNDLVATLGEEYYKSDPNALVYKNEINPEKYSLEIVPGNGNINNNAYFTATKFDTNHSWLKTREDGTYIGDGTWYMGSNLVAGAISRRLPLQETLTYNVKCPAVFGDDSVHVIVAYWAEDIQRGEWIRFPRCTKATFDGKEITPIRGISYSDKTDDQYSAFFLDIVLQ
ncbi:MAG: hypothetical protein J5508_05640 [Bacteroidales bacterium]|nr:hypothetical protein [Bacteroidales bacterium]MBR5671096.1 hypothetical protein [Bacteroidales bacterium]